MSDCDHIIGMWEGDNFAALNKLSDYVDDDLSSELEETFAFCPSCGERLNWEAIGAAKLQRKLETEARWAREEEARNPVLRWPV